MSDRYVVREMDRDMKHLGKLVERGYITQEEAQEPRWEVWDTVQDKRVPFGISRSREAAQRDADRWNRR